MIEKTKESRKNRIYDFLVAKKRNLVVALFAVLVIGVIAGTFAWFYESTKSKIVNMKGSVEYADFYFDGGTGTEDDPYQIKDAQQFYNFAWLQYLGVFNKTDEQTGKITQVYFILTDDINMAGNTLPPIGTEKNPFVGNFDGDGHTVSNVSISNKIGEGGIAEDKVPSLVDPVKFNTDATNPMNIVGLFGVVGEKATNDGYNYDTQVNEIKNLNLRDSTIKTQTSQTLIGMIAGYVNGTLSNVTVNDCDVDIANAGVAALGADNGYTDQLSDYGTVGYCTEDFKDNLDVEKVQISKPKLELSSITDSEQGDAWGGSINMVDMHNRLTNVYNAGSSSVMKYYESQTINIDDATGMINVENGNVATTTPRQAYNSIYYNETNYSYPSDVVGGSQGNAGNYALHPTTNGRYIGVLGRPTDLGNTVTVNRYLDEFKDAYYIMDGTEYLNLTDTGSIDNSNTERNTRWVIDYGSSSTASIYTIVNGVYYYLVNNNGTLAVETSSDNSWTEANGSIYSTKNDIEYYLLRIDGRWQLTSDNVYIITDNAGHYLNALPDATLEGGTDNSTATNWLYDIENFYLYTWINGAPYYLYLNPETGNVEMTDEANKHHVVYVENKGIYNVNEDAIDIGSWEIIGTVNESDFVDVTSYVLETEEIKDNEYYVILSANNNNGPRVLYNGSYESTRTDQVSIDSLSSGSDPIVAGTTLDLLINTAQTEDQQTWLANIVDGKYSLMGVASEKYLDLTTETNSNSSAYLSATPRYLSIENEGADFAKKVYQTVGEYSPTTVTLNRNNTTADVSRYVGYYYLGDTGYEKITSINISTFGILNKQLNITTVESVPEGSGEEGAPNTYKETLSFYNKNFTFYQYDDSTQSMNYLVHNNNTKFYTSSSTTGNELYFFKKVKNAEATKGTVQTEYLDRFINYADNMMSSSHENNELWTYLEEILNAAKDIRASVDDAPVDIDTARQQQMEVNTITKYLRDAILLIQAPRYYVAYNNAWCAVAEDTALSGSVSLGWLVKKSTQIEAGDSMQMVEQTIKGTGLPTFFPINGKNDVDFSANNANTGYICSAGSTYQSYSGDIRVSWFNMNDLGTSLNSTTNLYTSGTSNLQVLTRSAKSTGTLNRIDDDYNNVNDCSPTLSGYVAKTPDELGLQKYEEARKNLEEKALDGKDKVYGLHFMDAIISEDETFVAPYAKINGVEYTNYEMPEACIDFQLKEKGFINFFAGSYYVINSSTKNNSFFSLYEINRKGNTISSIKEIFKIYGDPNDPSKPYLYTYSSGETVNQSGYQLMFDTDWIKNPTMEDDSMYYYEIPTNAGEYALGSVENKYGAYLVYLDISANKQEVHRQKLSELTTVTTSTYEYPKGVQVTSKKSDKDNPIDETDSVAVSIAANPSNSGTVNLTRGSLNEDVVTVDTGELGAGVTAKYTGDGLELKNQSDDVLTAQAISSKVKRTYKETYFDYNTTKASWTKTEDIVTETIDSTNTTVRNYEQYINGTKNEDVTGSGPAIQALTPTAITYHYVLPSDATVTNTSVPTIIADDGMSLTGIDTSEYPAIGAKEVDASEKINAYNVTIEPSAPILMRMDEILNGFKAYVNGSTNDMKPGESIDIN